MKNLPIYFNVCPKVYLTSHSVGTSKHYFFQNAKLDKVCNKVAKWPYSLLMLENDNTDRGTYNVATHWLK